MRLFAAVDLNDTARVAIAAEQKQIAAALGERRTSVRWVQPDRMHLTLVFLGEVSDAAGAAAVDSLGVPVDMAPFDMALQGFGVFPPHGAPRAVWVGVTTGGDALLALQQEIARRVAAIGVTVESRPFQAHLTLGRWRESRSSDRRQVLAASTDNVIARVRIAAATLYQSRLSSAGPSYTALAHARLSGA
jgi:2'-5' RNA ligase